METIKREGFMAFLLQNRQIISFFMVSIYDNTLTNFANNAVQNKSFGRYFYIHR